ncbi:iron-sulfur cluster repair protein YtfE [Ramlibacter sp. MAHUQ-53]|uniref:iron-sulfur cluster repair protein YtfE n=1 Tax=unclassified Ramlibacter TaxID=2617605 RepID=UPI00362CA998
MNAVLEPAVPATLLQPAATLGEIAARVPGATAVFRRHKLDFCCGGNVALDQAARAKGLDAQALLAELREAAPAPDGQAVPTEAGALIDHLLARYHEVHRRQLPELERMARRVEAVHADHPQVPAGLAQHLEAMQSELLSHMEKEEQVLFPVLRRGGHPMAAHPITMMRHEHLEHGQALETLDRLTQEMTPPPGACNTWRALYTGLAQLKSDLMEHIHLENNCLFPAFEGQSPGESQGGCGSGGACGCA